MKLYTASLHVTHASRITICSSLHSASSTMQPQYYEEFLKFEEKRKLALTDVHNIQKMVKIPKDRSVPRCAVTCNKIHGTKI